MAQRNVLPQIKQSSNLINSQLIKSQFQAHSVKQSISEFDITQIHPPIVQDAREKSNQFLEKALIWGKRVNSIAGMIEANSDQLLEVQSRYNKKNYPIKLADFKSEMDKVEHQLLIARQKYNEAQDQYCFYIQQIDIVRKEIQCYTQASQNMQKQLDNTRQDISSTKTISTSVQNNIRTLQDRIKQIGNQQNKENYLFRKRMEETSIKLNRVRVENLKAQAQQKNKNELEDQEIQAVDPIDVQHIRKQIQIDNLKEMKKQRYKYTRQIQKIQDGFNQMLQKSKMYNIDQVVQTFANSEESNSKLYSRLNYLTQQITELEEQSGKLQSEIKKYQDLSMSEEQMNLFTQSSQDKVSSTQQQVKDLDSQIQKDDNKLKILRNKFGSLDPFVQISIEQLKCLKQENRMDNDEI